MSILCHFDELCWTFSFRHNSGTESPEDWCNITVSRITSKWSNTWYTECGIQYVLKCGISQLSKCCNSKSFNSSDKFWYNSAGRIFNVRVYEHTVLYAINLMFNAVNCFNYRAIHCIATYQILKHRVTRMLVSDKLSHVGFILNLILRK